MKKGVEAAELEGSGESNNRARQAREPLRFDELNPCLPPFTTKP